MIFPQYAMRKTTTQFPQDILEEALPLKDTPIALASFMKEQKLLTSPASMAQATRSIA
ncbi:hypothetical protein [Desulfosporosinus sp. FKB]|uniref:hypothetical protein n=1 Tax=Desulfosporosinus sp. FKB TaxID=1969835 RepID=UPI001482DECA|nr:hypothetical protein [Desulfosporosinus sp. FKB]